MKTSTTVRRPANDRTQPSQKQLIFPMLEVLHEAGGRAAAVDVAETLAARFGITPEAAAETTVTRDGQVVNLWRRHVRFARQKARELGFITSERRGADWTLTEAGYEGVESAAPAVLVELVVDKDGGTIGARINLAVGIPTSHLLAQGDARKLSWIENDSIPLIVTSIPYFDIKDYGRDEGQLANLASYDAFLAALDVVWQECLRVLIPGGRMAVNVGDVLRSRSRHGEHCILPLHADVLARSTRLGFRALNGILWSKIGNVAYEERGSGILGKPGQPNGVIALGHEHILLARKPGPYRKPTPAQQQASALSKDEYQRFFRPIWSDIPGARATTAHPAPFPVEVPYRLSRMFSFAGDTVLDLFAGSGTTALGAAKAGRNSASVDISATYIANAVDRICSSAARGLHLAV